MRIDQPSGNLAVLSGSFEGEFKGTFTGTVTDLSESFAEVYQTIDTVSESIDTHLLLISGNLQNTITSVSESFSRSLYGISESISTSLYNISESISTSLYGISESISTSLYGISESISTSLYDVSESISTSLGSEIYLLSESVRGTYATKTQLQNVSTSISSALAGYEDFVDETYYKSGSSALLSTLFVSGTSEVGGDLTVHGNLDVQGTASYVHTKDVYVDDIFVEIAVSASTPAQADGAGFGIGGANVTMSYNSAENQMYLNKNLVTNLTGSVEGTASYAEFASEIADDGVIAAAIADLANKTIITASNPASVVSDTIYLNCGALRSYQTCSITGSTSVTLDLPERIIGGIEHYLLLTNTGANDCYLTGSAGIMVPPTVYNSYKYYTYTVNQPTISLDIFNGKVDGGNSSATPVSRSIQFTVSSSLSSSEHTVEQDFDCFKVYGGESLMLTYFTAGTSAVVITSAQRLKI